VLHDEHARRTNYLSKGTRHGFPALQDHSTVIVGIGWPMTDPVRMSTHDREAPTLQHGARPVCCQPGLAAAFKGRGGHGRRE
jgi:dTDP-4-dehydrorhamnose 3,5-epimerase-like enzyme